MIHKIEQLVSIGKFRNYQASGDVSFRKLTLVYADNGAGKTTLTAVIRSLSQDRPEIVKNRISTNHSAPQAAKVIQRTRIIPRTPLTRDTHHTFRPTGWSNPFPNIEIFDTHFIAENIYSGFDFNEEQKKQLYDFVIGAQGVAIKEEIERNKIEKTTLRQSQTNLENQLIQQVANGLTADSMSVFLNIAETDNENIDAKITAANTALGNARSNAVIRTLQGLIQLNSVNSGIDFDDIVKNLQTTTQTIQDEILEEIFENHCSDLSTHGISEPLNWLKKGFNYLQSKQQEDSQNSLTCPFCKEPINNQMDIIKAYTIRFNEAFNTLINNLQSILSSLLNFNLEASLQVLDNASQTNSDRVLLWASHLPPSVQAPTYNVVPNKEILKAEIQALIISVTEKIQKPSVAVASDNATTFRASLESINTNIAAYNQSVIAYNKAIAELRAGIQTEEQAQAEVNRLNRIKKRFDAGISALCTQLNVERQALRGLETAYTQLVQRQEREAMSLFTNYKDRINHYLEIVFKTPFKIEDVSHIPPQGRATQSKISYKLTLDGHDIAFDPTLPYSMRDCLSEGDKSTIALAFFLSKLDIDVNKANKSLIFDDPLSSFDRNRRLYTANLIKKLLSDVKQIIVLSHSESFLHELTKGIAAGDKKTLVISENLLTKESKIEPLDLDALVEIEYFKHIKELESFLTSPDINKKERVLGLMRNVLEAHIRFKFYRQTLRISPTNKTFGTLIDTLESQGVVFRSDTTPPSIISKLRVINAISLKPHHGEPIPDYGALGVDPNTMTVVEIGNFIGDTFDLIDNRL